MAGHPSGWVGIFGSGGWLSIPVAACLGLVLVAVFHGARWMLAEVAEGHADSVPVPRRRPAPTPRPPLVPLPSLAGLAAGMVGSRSSFVSVGA